MLVSITVEVNIVDLLFLLEDFNISFIYEACGKVLCANCCSHKAVLKHLGYLDEQRVCNNCINSISTRCPKPSKSYLKNVPPIQFSESVMFAPPSSPAVRDDSEEEDEEIVTENTMYYYDFDIIFEKKLYRQVQVSVSKDRILITAFSTAPPFRTGDLILLLNNGIRINF